MYLDQFGIQLRKKPLKLKHFYKIIIIIIKNKN